MLWHAFSICSCLSFISGGLVGFFSEEVRCEILVPGKYMDPPVCPLVSFAVGCFAATLGALATSGIGFGNPDILNHHLGFQVLSFAWILLLLLGPGSAAMDFYVGVGRGERNCFERLNSGLGIQFLSLVRMCLISVSVLLGIRGKALLGAGLVYLGAILVTCANQWSAQGFMLALCTFISLSEECLIILSCYNVRHISAQRLAFTISAQLRVAFWVGSSASAYGTATMAVRQIEDLEDSEVWRSFFADTLEANMRHAGLIFAAWACLGCAFLYMSFLMLRRKRRFPPNLSRAKFIRLGYLREMLSQGLELRRCQDLPHYNSQSNSITYK